MAKASKKTSKKTERISFRAKQAVTLDLLLDNQNPRLHPDERGVSQPKLLEIMLERFAINEIAESICSSGFLPLDPFVGYADRRGMVILEGNRRLATLWLLLDADLCPIRYADRWAEYRKRLARSTRISIEKILVYFALDRAHADVLSYVGFRHVNGILGWEAGEKGAYIAMLVERERWSYEQIANSIGSKAHFVERQYVGHRFVEQAREANTPGTDRMRAQFGVLNRALQSPKIREFLGVSYPHAPKQSKRPCTKPSRDLEEFVRWTFGTDEQKPVLEDSRDLTKWGTVLTSSDAVRYLRTADDPRFDRAYAKSGGLKEGLVESLHGAADRLEEAIPLIRQHRNDGEVQKVVDRCADYFVQILRYFEEIQEKQGLKLDAPTA